MTCAVLLLGELSPLVTSQRCVQKGLAEAAANLSSSLLVMSAPRPAASSWRALHWMAICPPSERLTATASMPISCWVVPGKRVSRSGQSLQR